MADERKSGVSFTFSKKKSSNKAYSTERNALDSDAVNIKEEEKDYILSAEGKELRRLVLFLQSVSMSGIQRAAGENFQILGVRQSDFLGFQGRLCQ